MFLHCAISKKHFFIRAACCCLSFVPPFCLPSEHHKKRLKKRSFSDFWLQSMMWSAWISILFFFSVTKVNFLCLPYRHCEQRNRFKKGESGRPENAEGKRKGICDLSQTADDEKWEQLCTQKNPNSLLEMWEIRDDPQMSWFTCETDTNMDELYNRISASGNIRWSTASGNC